MMCAKSRKHREKKKEMLLEGSRLIKDAVEAGSVLKMLFFSRVEALEDLPMDTLKVPIYKVQHHSLKLWSDLVTPPGVMGIFQIPNQGEISMERTDVIPVTLVCDNIRDPGNLGTIIRVGAAVGCERILCTKGCVDIWEPKVLRSGAGCHFRVPIINNLEWETVVSYFPAESMVCLADVGKVRQSKDYRSRLRVEDLRKLLEQSTSKGALDQGTLQASEDFDMDSGSNNEKTLYRDRHTLALFKRLQLPSNVYHQVDFSRTSSVLVVSNESEGPSPQAKKAVFDNYGQAVVVPMAMNVESLNNSVATGVILFEIKRQLTVKDKIDVEN
ncbi:rRNA methyltransferase 3, mitochondrial-like isoform X2 [Liolophura sinensis]